MKHYQKYLTKRVCERCGNSFDAYIYNVRRGWGRFCSNSCSKKGNSNRVGKVLSTESRFRISQSLKKRYELGELVSPLVSLGIVGRRGEKSPNWRGGKTLIGQMIRRSLTYKEWRMSILQRDDFTCQECGTRGGKLHVDHIKSFADYPELRFDKTNARTLCIPCHRNTVTWGAHKKQYVLNKAGV